MVRTKATSRMIFTALLAALLLTLAVVGMGTQPVAAAVPEIPEGATIDSATFSVYNGFNRGVDTISVHRITAPWTEMGVTWNSFANAYDPTVIDSVVTPGFGIIGWLSFDVTGLVQDWVDGTYPNYGIKLHQGTGQFKSYHSSEYDTDKSLRPKLEICYTADSVSDCITIQRPGEGQDGVADASISDWTRYFDDDGNPIDPPIYYGDMNMGDQPWIGTGPAGVYAGPKQSLVRFEFTFTPPPPPPGGEGCTPGYWKNHPVAWPPTGYSPDDDFDTVFGVDFFDPDVTLMEALNTGGGGIYRLGRHGTAALLSAAHPDVGYNITVAEVIALVQAGDADTLEIYNEQGCPIDAHGEVED